jgi:hypothetical protein
MGAAKGGRTAAEGFGVWWIDLAGMIVLPLAVAFVVVHGVLRKATKR